MTRWLALDTATEACSVALWQDGRVLERFEVAGRDQTQRLLPMMHAVLAEAAIQPAQLDGFVCGVGPGSFAGVRIGVGLIKGMALALDRPVVPVTSLCALAQRRMRLHAASHVVAVIDARMQQVYAGTYVVDVQGRAQPMQDAAVCAPEALSALPVADWQGAGSGWATYESVLRKALAASFSQVDGVALPHAEDALHWARHEWEAGRGISADALEPVYLRDKVALTLLEQAKMRSPA